MRVFLLLGILCATTNAYAQNDTPQPIRTAIPFLTITPDALSSAMADIGVATLPDAFSQHHNPAKYAFTEHLSELSVSYTPWLNNITGDMFIGYISYYHKIREKSAIGTSLRYFSLGSVEVTDYLNGTVIPLGEYKPLELSLDVSYSMQVSQRVSLGMALRYTRSDITDRSNVSTSGFHAGNAISADIAVYYVSKVYELEKSSLSFSFGLNIKDIGSKVNYGNTSIGDGYEQMPSMMMLGAGVHLFLPNEHSISFHLQTNKILVPTPVYDYAEGTYITPDKGIFGSLVSALTDAPNGFGEKISEYSFQIGTQYSFGKSFSARTGWYYGDAGKGGFQFLSAGLSGRYKNASLYLSYNIPTARSWDDSPISGTLRVSLCFALGKTYDAKD